MEEEKSSPKPHWRARLASLTQRLALPVPSAAAATPALPAHLRSGQAAEDAAAALLQDFPQETFTSALIENAFFFKA